MLKYKKMNTNLNVKIKKSRHQAYSMFTKSGNVNRQIFGKILENESIFIYEYTP